MLRAESDLGGPTDDMAPTRSKPSIVDAKADNNEETDYAHLSAATFAHSRSFRELHDWPYRIKHHSGPDYRDGCSVHLWPRWTLCRREESSLKPTFGHEGFNASIWS